MRIGSHLALTGDLGVRNARYVNRMANDRRESLPQQLSDEAEAAQGDNSSDSVEASGDGGWLGLVVQFLGTPAGHALNAKVADWVGAHNDANRIQQKRDTTAMHWRYVLMALVIVTAAGLRIADKLDSSIVGFLGLSLGYLFGRADKKSE